MSRMLFPIFWMSILLLLVAVNLLLFVYSPELRLFAGFAVMPPTVSLISSLPNFKRHLIR